MQDKTFNKVKRKLKEGKMVAGPWVHIGHPDIAEILGIIGFDFVIYDTEHTPLSLESIQCMMQVMEGSGVAPLIRVAWNDPVLIKRALDIGAYGVLIPWVNTSGDAKQAVEACRYAPEGIRGCSPRRAARYGHNFLDYFERFVHEELIIAVQIETKQAIDNLDKILSVEGIDLAFIGPLDLSVSLGIPAQWNSGTLKDAIKTILHTCKKHKVAAGIDAQNIEDVRERAREGFQFISFSSDTDFLFSAAKDAYAKLSSFFEEHQ